MATGIRHDASPAYGVFDAIDHQARLEILSPAVAAELKTKSFAPGLFSASLPFNNFQPKRVYKLQPLEHLSFNGEKFTSISIPREVNERTIQQVTSLFFDLNCIFVQATQDYKVAIQNNDENLEVFYQAYTQAKESLTALIDKYQNSDLVRASDYFQSSFNAITTQHTEETLFDMPKARSLDDLVGGDKAYAALDNYQAIKRYFTGPGRYASDAFKTLHMSACVYQLNESISGLASHTDKQAFFHTHMNNPSLIASFQADQVKYLKRFTQDEFNTLAMKYLFNMEQRDPSEEFRRRAALDPSQRAALHTWMERKHAALDQGKVADWYKLPTRCLSDAVWGAVNLVEKLQLGNRKSVDEIILEGFRISQNSWFTSRSLGNFYDEKDAELLLLTKQEESSPQAIQTRKVAQRELTKRTLDAAKVAWERHRTEFDGKSIPGLLDTAEHAENRESSLLALRNIYAALEDPVHGIFGRLDLVARINLELYPTMASKHLPLTDEGIMYNAYTAIQTLIKGEIGQRSLTDALKHAIDLVEQDSPGLAQAEQIALKLDDYRFLLKFIPVYESIIRFGNRETKSTREHPNLDRVVGFGGLKGIKKDLEAKIAELETQAASLPVGSVAVTTSYLLERFPALEAAASKLAPSAETTALSAFLSAQKATAESVFQSVIEPNAQKRKDYFKAINDGLTQIETNITNLSNYLTAKQAVSEAEQALETARRTSTYKFRTDPAITRAQTALAKAENHLAALQRPISIEALTLPAALFNFEQNL